MAGSYPGEEREELYQPVVFIGQAPVKVRGPVQAAVGRSPEGPGGLRYGLRLALALALPIFVVGGVAVRRAIWR